VKRVFLHRGQNFLDLALIIGVVGLVFIGMEAYIKRGIQGKVKDATDFIISDTQSAGDTAARDSDLEISTSMISEEHSEGEAHGRRRFHGTENSVYTYNTSQ